MLRIAVFLAYLLAKINSQFIIDSQNPIVISENNDGTENSKLFTNTLFGYSMAFLGGEFKANSVTQSSSVIGTLFIGAPNDSTKGTINSGIVWSCQFRSNGQTNCSILTELSNQPAPPSCRETSLEFLEADTDQWIGASLTTSRQNLYACAPRWKQNGYEILRDGRCRTGVSRTSLSGVCYKSASSNKNLQPTILGPFYERNRDTFQSDWYRYNQFGFSSHITRSQNLIVGIPSSNAELDWNFNGRGIYVEYDTSNGHRRLVPNMDSEFYSYLGYSVTSGTNMGGVVYAAVGAPRANHYFGAVLVNEFGSQTPNLRVFGEQFGGYFGFSLATADLNGDGDDELLVGAPHFTQDFDTKESFNGGCIYIYDVDLRTKSVSQMSRICLERLQKGARFGSTIANFGDINFDQREDFAVAAPYYGDGVGAVFIYYGGLPFSTTPAQIILGETFEIPNLRGFGTSLLSGNFDVDGNSSPDLAISSFESNHVVILRSRPIAIPFLKISYHSANSIENDEKINSFLPTESNKVFRIRICNNFNFSVVLNINNTFQIECRLSFELDRRVQLVNQGVAVATGTELMYNFSSTRETCVNELVEVSMERLENNNEDPVRIRVSLSYNATKPNGVVPVQAAILNFSESQESNPRFESNFLSFKPLLPVPIEDAFSEWEALEMSQDNCESDGNSMCDPKLEFLSIDIGFENRDGNFTRYPLDDDSLLVGQVEKLIVLVILRNHGETAYRPVLIASFKLLDNKFELPQTEWQWQLTEPSGRVEIFQDTPSVNTIGNDTVITGSFSRPSRPLHDQTQNVYRLEISNLNKLKVINSLTGMIQLKIEAFPQGQQDTELVSSNYTIPLKAQVNIEVEAVTPETGQSEINPNSNRIDLSQIFLLKNTGVSSVKEVKVEMYVPTHSRVNETYTQILGVILRCEAHGFSFYQVELNSDSDESSQNLRPESLTTDSRNGTKKPILPSVTDEMITLSSCGVNTLSSFCRKLTCLVDLPSMETRAIRIHMYLLPATSVAVISRKGNPTGIRIQTVISVSYLETMEIRMDAFTMRMFIMPQEIPAWMVLVAGTGGLIIFLLVAVALHKCGFFRRKTKEELNQLKRQTQTWLELNNFEETFPLNVDGAERSSYTE
ncbi:unnamed protein product [Orchesella dallaii]|uniref:Integrin alpha-2 domain-containing protein n=1 Tax=Orchesella dallaii TaxID=48710 RepID=A0ABP1R4X9_9HEXA